jgi:hypothetical protein
MKHSSTTGRKLLRWLGAALAVLVLLLAVFVAWNWSYIKPVLQGLGVLPMSTGQTEEWDELEQEIEQGFASSAAAEVAASAQLPEQTPEASDAPQQEEPAASEAPAESEVAAGSEAPAASESPTATPTATPTPAASATATPTASPTPTGPDYEQEVQACVAEMKAMENKFEKRLYGIVKEALDEYLALPESSRNLVKKVSIILSKKGALEAMEKECDAEVDEILTRMRAALAASGQDDTLAREAESAYKKKKADTIAELTKLTYSGGNGEGTTQQWFWEHGV